MKKIFSLALLLLAIAIIAHPQTTKAPKRAKVALSDPVRLGTHQIKVLNDRPEKAFFHLTVSWIAGKDNKGYLRYRIDVTSYEVYTDNEEFFYSQLKSCRYTLEIYDKGGFVVARIPVQFTSQVDDKGVVSGISTNDFFQLSLPDYKLFRNSGEWSMTWSC